jgi:hypothetical protein
MSIESRLTRLRALAERVERLPASPRRQWMLSETRVWLVDVETGEPPRAMRPLAAEPPPRSAEQAPWSTAGSEPLGGFGETTSETPGRVGSMHWESS